MQVNPLNHLLFPTDGSQTATGKHAASPATPASTMRPSAQEMSEAVAPEDARTSSVVLKIHSAAIPSTNSAAFNNPVYANPQGKAATPDRQADFVSFAVSAMRDFADESERAKKAAGTAPTATPNGKFQGLHQLAARFHLFT